VAELGNLTARIFLPLGRMSTVKIRTGSLFRTSPARIGACGAAFHPHTAAGAHILGVYRELSRPINEYGTGFPPPSTDSIAPSQDVHRRLGLGTCTKLAFRCKVNLGAK